MRGLCSGFHQRSLAATQGTAQSISAARHERRAEYCNFLKVSELEREKGCGMLEIRLVRLVLRQANRRALKKIPWFTIDMALPWWKKSVNPCPKLFSAIRR